MTLKQLIFSAVASAVFLPFFVNMPAKAYSCGELLRAMELAYDKFQEAEAAGNEKIMLQSYLAFEALVDQAKSQGCK